MSVRTLNFASSLEKHRSQFLMPANLLTFDPLTGRFLGEASQRLTRRARLDYKAIVTVFLPALLVILATHGKLFAVADRRNALAWDAEGCQIIFRALRPLGAQRQIILRRAAIIAVPLDLNRARRVLFQPFGIAF